MAKYSEANLIDEELFFIRSNDIISKMFYKMSKSSSISLKLEIPLHLYLRGEVLTEDIMEMAEVPFNQSDLLNLLYREFLNLVQRRPDPMEMFKRLSVLEAEVNVSLGFKKQGESNIFTRTQAVKPIEMKRLHCIMRRKYALRGEVMLADMETVQKEHGYTLEKVLELLYIDFIEKFKTGNSKNAIDNILHLISDT